MRLWLKLKELGIDFSLTILFLFFFLFSSLQVASLPSVVFFLQKTGGVFQGIQAEKQAAREVTKTTLDYLQGEEVDLAYTTREKFHLEEVRSLFLGVKKAWFILTGVVFGVIVFARWTVLGWPERIRVITKGLTLFFLAADLLVLFFFSSLFTLFHEALFSPGTWQFGEKDLLITLFPYRFWVIETALVLSFSAFLSTFFSFILNLSFFQKKDVYSGQISLL